MIDWNRVRELQAEIGEEDFAEVAAMFLDESDDVIARLSPGMEASALEQGLHFLKGAALNLGFAQLARLCQGGERQAAAGVADFDLDPVRASYAASRQEFLDNRGTAAV